MEASSKDSHPLSEERAPDDWPYRVCLTVVAGEAPSPVLSFASGTSAHPLSVGTEADWVVTAEGVHARHLQVAFDGRQLYAAAASRDGRVQLNGVGIDEGWWIVQPPAELRFGDASIRVDREEIGRASSMLPIGVDGDTLPVNGVVDANLAGTWPVDGVLGAGTAHTWPVPGVSPPPPSAVPSTTWPVHGVAPASPQSSAPLSSTLPSPASQAPLTPVVRALDGVPGPTRSLAPSVPAETLASAEAILSPSQPPPNSGIRRSRRGFTLEQGLTVAAVFIACLALIVLVLAGAALYHSP